MTARTGVVRPIWYPWANRDEDALGDAWRFDIGGVPNPQIGFGAHWRANDPELRVRPWNGTPAGRMGVT
jgi:hypothetical protein